MKLKTTILTSLIALILLTSITLNFLAFLQNYSNNVYAAGYNFGIAQIAASIKKNGVVEVTFNNNGKQESMAITEQKFAPGINSLTK